jgi:hypothetical protein
VLLTVDAITVTGEESWMNLLYCSRKVFSELPDLVVSVLVMIVNNECCINRCMNLFCCCLVCSII